MKKVFPFIVFIVFLSSCTNVMEEKVTTKEYENYKKVLFSIDTLDTREKEYIIEQSKEMIIAKGALEKEYGDIGLKVDTSELPTFGEFYNRKSQFWRSMNSFQKATMRKNVIIDTTNLKVKIMNVKAHFLDTGKKEKTRLKNRWLECFWICHYSIKIEGVALVKHNLSSLKSFVNQRYYANKMSSIESLKLSPDEFSIYINDVNNFLYEPTFERFNDSMYRFSLIEEHSLIYRKDHPKDFNYYKSGMYSFCDTDYFPDKIIENDKRVNDEINETRNDFLRNKELTLNLREILLTGDYPSGKAAVNSRFLTRDEYTEYESAKNGNADSNTIDALRVKYGLNLRY